MTFSLLNVIILWSLFQLFIEFKTHILKGFVMKKFFICLLFTASFLTLSGCTIGTMDVQDLMSPPKSNDDQQEIYDLLKTDEGELNFAYPKRGDYRSALITEDLNHDSKDEAIGFIEDPEGGIIIQFMFESEDGWQITDSYKNAGAQVDKVFFGDLSGDGENEMIVGWGSPQSLTATISVYKYENDRVIEYALDHTYNELMLIDINEDGIMDLFTSTVFTPSEDEMSQDRNAVARIFSFDQKPILKHSVILDNTVVRYTSVSEENLSLTDKVIVLEGVASEGNTVTQILTLKNDILNTPLATEEFISKYNNFSRSSSLSIGLMDLDEDSVIEFPIVRLQPGLNPEEVYDPIQYYVDWVELDPITYEAVLTERTIISLNNNFMFEVNPDKEIRCYQSTSGNYFISQNIVAADNTSSSEKHIYTLSIFSGEQWENLENQEDYELLFTSENSSVYALQTFGADDYKIKNSIRLINEDL